ncbi:ParB family chromosome partitioning protein [Clostridium tetanomorphum]|uniref:Nucleoid occlusion protein n=1 Tax=Clostridium tetanomorphum TaxID=1553 RepID=A0A923E9C3_CLOTT|nr:nucleoid occlusion protein [Clostridium tetanomorphum]KAJ49560.1 stage 0 sporulation protein J [Clostridium tetanomorphum DSM 665]KAJ50021.1 stage 0 sporulation protein J [Clostridium tetanomorphum DSM 665]MBC2399002.1 nucleoid occlusion protein [Clostridium tetanomorphum]MBP1866208.1 ParB family chromosome partitioning protein [Clostridium tetanomorphum]NRS86600.1 ParB family chromosome partitioning protein [Clostridium tetanomorphum]
MEENINYVNIDLISPNVYQPRKIFNEEAIDELAKSIKSYGIIQPLSVRRMGDSRYELVAGERRLRAAKKIGLKEVPVIIVDVTDKESAAIALLENIQREDLNFLEEAEAYYNLIREHSYTQEKLAELIGKKQSTIANKIRLLKLPQRIRKKLLESNLTERHARALLKLPTEELQKKVLNTVIKKSLNVKKTEELINKELIKITENNLAKDGRKRIKGIFSAKVYINTVKQVFDKYGVTAQYTSKELDDKIQITISIPKK